MTYIGTADNHARANSPMVVGEDHKQRHHRVFDGRETVLERERRKIGLVVVEDARAEDGVDEGARHREDAEEKYVD